MLHFDDIVFGPIRSRRLGSSLGVNILPSKGKLCNFDCIYCECGWNKDGSDRGPLPSYDDVKAALEAKITALAEAETEVDSITFSGNGEPTMHPDFDRIVDLTIELRNRYYPQAKVSVLSNAVLTGRKSVVDALMKVDNPILKIDASSDELIRQINKPVGSYHLAEIVEALKKFNGNFVLQTMFLRSNDFDTAEPEALKSWMNIVRELRPREIMVYTIDRETPDKSLGKYSIAEMTAFVQPLLDEGFKIQVRG
jgi:wyosine [tRNA(Phe)-imidazoG37] synthetase (radical SAM superfamily)